MAIVCVTGASGFLGSWLVKRLLEAGYHVRGTVRDLESSAHLWELEGSKERLKLLEADLLTEGIFDSIVEGCQGVFHTAASCFLTAENPERDIVQVTVFGTLNVLRSCKKSSTVKRVVLTSSSATVRFSSEINPDTIIDESIWSSIDDCRKNKRYYAWAKTQSEQEAWEYARTNEMDLVTIVPGFFIGPLLSAEPRSTVTSLLTVIKGNVTHVAKNLKYKGYVHLDDVASAHILVYEAAQASGRYMCSPVDLKNYELVDALARKLPEYKIPEIPVEFRLATPSYKGYSRKKLEALGMRKFKGIEEMLDDLIESLKLKGII